MGGASGEPSRDEQQTSSIILVVEDEVLVRMMIADELRNAGYTVLEASNADEALEVLRHTSEVALVFTDLRMPGSMDGMKFAGFVRSEYPVLKIVLTSGDLAALTGLSMMASFRNRTMVAKLFSISRPS